MSNLIKPPSNYTTIPNYIINDARLSLKAKGLFLYLISKPDGWNFSADRIKNDCKDGEDSILSGLSELEKFGLLTRKKIRVGGVFKGFDYLLSFDISPSPENPVTVKPKREKPATEKPATEKPVHKKDSLSKKELKKEEREKTSLDIILNDAFDFTLHVDSFLDELCKSKAIKNPLSYRSKILNSLSDPKDKNHNRTKLAFDDFMTRYRPAPSLPVGVNIFDLIGRD